MNALIETLYENRRTSITYAELSDLFTPFLSTIKNGDLVDRNALLISFGTFLEVMQLHPTIAERWLDGMTSTINDLYLNSYQKYNTLKTFTTLSTASNTCLWEWWKCFCLEDDGLTEHGKLYRYPIDKKIDHLIEKYHVVDLLVMNKLYEMMSEFFDDYHEYYKNNQKYTTLYTDSLIIGIYISINAIKTLLDTSHSRHSHHSHRSHTSFDEIDLENSSSEKLKLIVRGYIIHLLQNDRNGNITSFSYAKHAGK